jgi:hypothetical protein
LLSSTVGAVSPPNVITGSSSVVTVELIVVVDPFKVRVPLMVTLPPTFYAPPIPNPPVTIKAPVPVPLEAVAFVILIAVPVVAPLPVTVANVSASVNEVKTSEPPEYNFVAYKYPP